MKKFIFLVVVFFCLPLMNYAQTNWSILSDTINTLDQHNLKQGFWVEENVDKTSSRGNYNNGKKEGSWIEYNNYGVLKKIETYRNGIRNGLFINIDKRGYFEAEEYFKNDELEGWSRHYSFGGRPISEIFYINGKIEGLKKLYLALMQILSGKMVLPWVTMIRT